MSRNSYGVFIAAVDTVSRPDGKKCLQVTWLDPATPSGQNARGSARTVPDSDANSQALERFHAYPDLPVDIVRNGRGQIVAVLAPIKG